MVRFGVALILMIVPIFPLMAVEPHFIVLPGIEGPSPLARGVVSGLRSTHPSASFEIFDWTTGHAYRMLYHLRDWNRNQIMVDRLAERIVSLQKSQPDQPIVLIGHSGGAALIVLALEKLPKEVQVQQAILLAPDLSPNYPLNTALDRTAYGIDVFHSRFDFLIQGIATRAVGTIDRVHTRGAGMVGFRTAQEWDENSRFLNSYKLRQHDYEMAMALSGHFGGHFTYGMPEFVKRYISPVLR